ncbi:D-alanyl-D-alanine dipeptidase [Magnetospirillum molischianum]|uniref:D-alanyl-D-alanine dipeptidase n=1 Tax=Magnetospirillum molischianum DSM 120 TaxID=1150626 RepID=H8FT82_MAGML|nr:D-alanyl-D-alanine dipeptidase [Magnetospirillum molischianum]CCG41570.1 D-alanyl-D-alanine dipeptidase [Magnetospirillum molischianum DSM 120]
MSPLVPISPSAFNIELALAYATANNFTGNPVYRTDADCWLHADAAPLLTQAAALAHPLGLRLRIRDAFRPAEAQWALWSICPDPEFLADPHQGSTHSMGVAVDVDLIDIVSGLPLDMGTGFDAFTPLSHHGRLDIPPEAQRHRALLLGVMTAAGWGHYHSEWWHYQIDDARSFYPLLSDTVLGDRSMMP